MWRVDAVVEADDNPSGDLDRTRVGEGETEP